MAAGDHQTYKRFVDRFAPEKSCMHVPFQVIHRDQGAIQSIGQGLSGADPHQQGADQPGTLGHGNSIESAEGYSGFIEGLGNDRQDCLHVFSGSKLRHHSTVRAVQGDLTRNDIGADAGPSSTTAAAVSSQEVSIPRINITSSNISF